MSSSDASAVINAYIEEVQQKFYSGIATEMAYRPALQRLIEGLCLHINAINDAKRVAVGAPDFVLTKAIENPHQTELFRSVPLGFLEAKDIKPGILDKPENQDQLKRYLELGNVIHTDSLTFRFYFNKELAKEICIGEVNGAGHIVVDSRQWEDLAFYFRQTVEQYGRTIRTAKALALHMADRARQIRHTILEALNQDIEAERSSELTQQYQAFKKTLLHELTPKDFADIYAETIAYGLFAARYNDDTPEDFSLQEAALKLPKTNPFLHKFFLEIAAYEREDRLNWVLDNFAELFIHADVQIIMSTYGRTTGMNHDPVTHFYETFLAEYDAKRRKARGVYYTPLPVVQFLVKAVDEILKSDFDLSAGLADDSQIDFTYDTQPYRQKYSKKDITTNTVQIPRVQILDPATGTGTFLNETIKHVYAQKGKNLGASWSSYVEQTLLRQLYGFELLMAAYAMAHMRLGLTLAETGYTPSRHPPRLGVYLTNTLEPPSRETEDVNLLSQLGMTRALSEESHAADAIKRDQPIMVVVGNPPYSGHSSNKTDFAQSLVEKYKHNIPELKKPAQAKWLSDDYVKFLSYAESMIDKNAGGGIVAMITNNGYLDNPTFRGMRMHLARTFDKLYILNLHGSTKKRETNVDGSADDNVFDIQQGVSIIVGSKRASHTGQSYGEVYRADVFGERTHKYDFLSTHSLQNISWEKVELLEPQLLFENKDREVEQAYDKGVSVAELFPLGAPGMVSTQDSFAVSINAAEMEQKVTTFLATHSEKEARELWRLCSQDQWQYQRAMTQLRETDWQSQIMPMTYRPFDTRWTVYNSNVAVHRRERVSRHMLHENVGLIASRINRGLSAGYVFISTLITDFHVLDTAADSTSLFPLYRYENDGLIANIDDSKLSLLLKNVGSYQFAQKADSADQAGSIPTITALNVLDYVYAALHSPTYRQKYRDFLRSDFPKVPQPTSYSEFKRLVELGSELRALHLMSAPSLQTTQYPFSGSGDNKVHKPHYRDGNLYINDTQYFENVPEAAWNFYIGGYQPAQKWLKDHTNLSDYKNIEHYQKILSAMVETNRIMQQIDAA